MKKRIRALLCAVRMAGSLGPASASEFFAWLTEAKTEYEANNPSIEIGSDGSIDLGDRIG